MCYLYAMEDNDSNIVYDYPAYMDYMDPDVLCPKNADKLNLSLHMSCSIILSDKQSLDGGHQYGEVIAMLL